MRLRLAAVLLFLGCASAADLAAQGGPPPPPPFAPLPAAPPIPAANPQLPAKIALGQALFWDEQLSKTGTVACGTCHMPRAGGTDQRTRTPNPSSVNPGADQVFNTPDDIVGSMGVPAHAPSGVYQFNPLFGMAPQVGTRQSQTAVNGGFPTTLFWDGRAGGAFLDPANQSVLIPAGGALENQALGPVVNSLEMAHAGGTLADMTQRIAGLTPLKLSPQVPQALSSWIAGRSYPQLFEEAFGTPDVSAARLAMAIASYERTLVSNQTPHDQQLAGVQGAMTQQELAGRQAFAQAGCPVCHGGPLLSDNNFHYIGVRPGNADPGRFAVTGNNADRGRMRTPPLRNIELSAPYMADGRFQTLEQVVAFYNRGGDFNAPNKDPRIVPLGLTPQQEAAIVTFLRRPLTDARVQNETGPFERPMLYTESSAVPQPSSPGTPGTGGAIPRLTAYEPPLSGSSEFTLGVDGGLPSAPARAVLALSDPTAATASALASIDFTLSGLGAGSVELPLPSRAQVGDAFLYLRVYVQDAAAAGGWSASGSVRFQLIGQDDALMLNGFED